MFFKKQFFFRKAIQIYFRPEGSTTNYFEIFVFGRVNKNEKEHEKFSLNEKWPVFRPSLLILPFEMFPLLISTQNYLPKRERVYFSTYASHTTYPPSLPRERLARTSVSTAQLIFSCPLYIFIVAMEEIMQEKVCKKKKRMQDYNQWVQRGVFKGVCIKGCVKRVCVQKGVSSKMCV